MDEQEIEAGNLFRIIQNELIEVNSIWNYYQIIYRGDTFDIVKSSAPIFFGTIQKAFQDKLINIISRLLDPEFHYYKKTANRNLSFETLFKQLEKENIDHQKLDDFIKRINEIKKSINTTLIKYRNKELSHNDLETMIESHNAGIIFSKFEINHLDKTIVELSNLSNELAEFIISMQNQPNSTLNKYFIYTLDYHNINDHSKDLYSKLRASFSLSSSIEEFE